ncbi:unnamed protein product [Durusdinium trenchii]|uniref:Uncharacterized protein n=1 Tax=Durusdinium trenchii TaxID=1381693 RepID=A0ABP0SM34_9DINO
MADVATEPEAVANSSTCGLNVEQDAQISKPSVDSDQVENTPEVEVEAEDALQLPAPTTTPLRRSRRPSKKMAFVLISVVLAAIALELFIMTMPSVPWLLDKIYFAIALVFQLLMVIASCPLPQRFSGEGSWAVRFRSKLLDVAHWAFVVMSFGGAILLRAPESLAFTAGIAAVSLGFRLSMRNRCIITSVARTSSLPRISGRSVTNFFLALLVVSVLRLLLQLAFGRGWPWDQLIKLISHKQ